MERLNALGRSHMRVQKEVTFQHTMFLFHGVVLVF